LPRRLAFAAGCGMFPRERRRAWSARFRAAVILGGGRRGLLGGWVAVRLVFSRSRRGAS
jgi:hypothetical protein